MQQSYLQAFCFLREDNEWVEPDFDTSLMTPSALAKKLADLPTLSKDEIRNRARYKLQDPTIKAYIEELKSPATIAAERVLLNTVLNRNSRDSDARQSAVKILERESEANRVDDALWFARLLEEVGAEIVVDLPTEATKDVVCPECDHMFHVRIPVEVCAPMALRKEASAAEEADA